MPGCFGQMLRLRVTEEILQGEDGAMKGKRTLQPKILFEFRYTL
jgi:hypothetical protein